MKLSQSASYSRALDRLNSLKVRFRDRWQRFLTNALTDSLSREVHVDYKTVEPLLGLLIKDHSDDALKVVRRLVGDASEASSDASDVDALINFSAYWRDDWVATKAAMLPAGAKVLDAGAGQCRYKPLFAHTSYHAQDFAQYEGSGEGPLKETWNYAPLDYVCDITQIPVEDGSFDAVLCTEVLEHVPDPISALRELCRVTREGGRLILTAPLGSGVHQEPYHFYGGFSPYFYQKFLTEFGCDVVEIKPIGGLLRHAAQELHRSARTIDASSEIMTPERRYLMMDWMPRLLGDMESQYFVEQFTVGYMVEARKRAVSSAS
jgi:SAM-dependent methyltransferase